MAQAPMKLDIKENRLSNFLGIKPEDSIDVGLLRALLAAKIPDGKDSITVRNPSGTGKKEYTLTKDNIGEVHRMVNLAINFKTKWKKGGE